MSMDTGALPADNTFVSTPGGYGATVHAGSTAPGAQGIGANISVSTAILTVIGGATVGLFVLGFLFRRGGE